MAEQKSSKEQIAIASTFFTTDLTAITKGATDITWPGGTTTIPTTLSLYGLGHGSISVITQTVACSTLTDIGTDVSAISNTDYQVFCPTVSITRSNNSSQIATTPSTSSLLPISTSPPTSSKGLSKVSAAGIGLGCAILGALIVTAFTFALLRRGPKRIRPRQMNSSRATTAGTWRICSPPARFFSHRFMICFHNHFHFLTMQSYPKCRSLGRESEIMRQILHNSNCGHQDFRTRRRRARCYWI